MTTTTAPEKTEKSKSKTADSKLIQGLNHAFNREVSTFLRYMQQVALLKGVEWDPLRKIYLEEVQDEMGHAQYLANKIVMLGGRPSLEPDLSPPPDDPRKMLKNDIDEEHVDVRSYKKLAALADDEGLIELKLRMEDQAADEARHAEQMQRLLG